MKDNIAVNEIDILKQVGEEPAYKDEIDGKKVLKFIITGAVGLFIFLAPVCNGTVPILQLVNMVKALFGENLTIIARLATVFMLVSLVLGKIVKVKPFEKYFEGDSKFKILQAASGTRSGSFCRYDFFWNRTIIYVG